MFQLETPLLELIARAAFLFALFMVLFRVLPRRTGGDFTPMDLVFLLLVTEAAAHSLGEFSSLADGTVQVLTLMALNYLTNRLSFMWPWFARLFEHAALPVIKDGQTIPRNLRRELITPEELIGHLRLQGVDEVSQVRSAHVESDGRLSVVKMRNDDVQGEHAEAGGTRAGA